MLFKKVLYHYCHHQPCSMTFAFSFLFIFHFIRTRGWIAFDSTLFFFFFCWYVNVHLCENDKRLFLMHVIEVFPSVHRTAQTRSIRWRFLSYCFITNIIMSGKKVSISFSNLKIYDLCDGKFLQSSRQMFLKGGGKLATPRQYHTWIFPPHNSVQHILSCLRENPSTNGTKLLSFFFFHSPSLIYDGKYFSISNFHTHMCKPHRGVCSGKEVSCTMKIFHNIKLIFFFLSPTI